MYQIKLANGKTFTSKDNETIFQAAQKEKIYLNHSCLNARCSSCKVKITSGNYVILQEESVLTKEEREQDFVLSCNTLAKSDLELDVEDLGDLEIYEKRTIPCKINMITRLNENVVKLELRLPPNQSFKFHPGQYVNLIKGTTKRSYSIANNTKEDGSLDFFIKNYQGGVMSRYFFEEANENDLLRLEGPLGTFFLRDTEKPLLFLATGTGIAPIKAIIEQIIASNLYKNRKITVLWGGRNEEDFFWGLDFSNEHIKLIKTLSRPTINWNGATGYVQNVAMEVIKDIENYQVYACGSNNMINDANKVFIKNGLPENQFFSDAFVITK
ncbi:FAD-binding oxidoreductase [Flavobacterium sp. ASW18X]|uniref:FAD-binding oxidoreductase n=1 Tax=Flavobacterium sp. ASW18X TaxID=2572595 RepID=UPI0010AE340C|nr:FAD-binding oxidoreductase [Flavobacterium sp. ASW18X]TKD65101.1 2Fe-2S iron-sulfur cluster binding domain-containing protein [Flavobacterium sp. ASW18X]